MSNTNTCSSETIKQNLIAITRMKNHLASVQQTLAGLRREADEQRSALDRLLSSADDVSQALTVVESMAELILETRRLMRQQQPSATGKPFDRKQKIPHGWRRAGGKRHIERGEAYMDASGRVSVWNHESTRSWRRHVPLVRDESVVSQQ